MVTNGHPHIFGVVRKRSSRPNSPRLLYRPIILESQFPLRLAYRGAYLQGGLDLALRDVARPGNAKRYRTDAEAQVAALACSDPPAGAGRWTVALLTEAARGPPQMRLDGPDHPGARIGFPRCRLERHQSRLGLRAG